MLINDAKLKFITSKLTRRDMKLLTKVYLHHAEGHGSVVDVNQWHKDRGWAGIGYNMYIREDGSIWKGRPLEYEPAGVGGDNHTSIHICLEGNFMKERPKPAQMNSLRQALAWYKAMFPNVRTCLGHKDYTRTDCPGVYFPLDEVKSYYATLRG